MSVIKGVNVGSTNITATYSDGTSESGIDNITVTALDFTSVGKISQIGNQVYLGISIKIEPTVIAPDVNGQDTTLIKDTDYTVSWNSNVDGDSCINVGTVTVTVSGKGNYTGTLTKTYDIVNANITVTSTNQSYTYDGNKHGNGIIISLVGSNDATSKFDINTGEYNAFYEPDFTQTSFPTIEHVSESGYVYYQVSAPNHNTVTGYYKLEITPKEATLQWGDSSWIYDGDSHSTTCVVTNLIEDDECTVYLLYNTITNLNTEETVVASGLSNSDYKLPSTGTSYTITIKPGLFIKVSGNWTPVKKVYKKINGEWRLQELSSDLFSESKLYMER